MSELDIGLTGGLKFVQVLDTRLSQESENSTSYALKEGAGVVVYNNLLSSSHSNSTTNFSLNNIGDAIARDSRMVMGLDVTLTMNMTNTTAGTLNMIQADNFGLKSYPLNKMISSIQHRVNQASYTLNTNEILDVITRLNHLPQDQNFYYNTQCDEIDNYAAATGSHLNPLQSYSTAVVGDGVFKPRSVGYTVTSGNTLATGATGNVIVNIKLYEPLITPFNNVSKKEARALYAINGESINITYVSDLFNNLICFVPPTGCTLNSTTVNLGNNASLFTQYLTPKPSTIAKIPNESLFPYNDYSIFNNLIATSVAAGASISAASQVVNFSSVPDKILIYARQQDNQRSATQADKYLRLDSLNVSLDNGLPCLNGSTTNDLYNISCRNGLQMSRPAFKQELLNAQNQVAGDLYGCGSVLVLDPAYDLGLRDGVTTASNGRFIFQVNNCNFTNATATTFNYVNLYVVGISNAQLKRVGSQYMNYLLTVPDNIVQNVQQLPVVSHNEYVDSKFSNSFMSGGGISDYFKKAYKTGTKAYEWIMNNKQNLMDAYDLGKKAYDMGNKMTSGSGSTVIGGASTMIGGNVLGGRLYNKTQKKNLKVYYN